MAFKKRRISGLVLDADHALGNAVGESTVKLGLGAKYGRVFGFRARNFASSAMAGAGTDTAQRVRLTDANGDIFYLDAADRDYATAEVTIQFVLDDTAVAGITATDATGAVRAAGEASPGAFVQGPITVEVVNGATATDFFVLDLLVEV